MRALHPGVARQTTTLILSAGFAGSMLAVVGCSSGAKPGPQRQEIIADSVDAENVRGEWAQAAEAGRVPNGWLKSFNDRDMEAVVAEALKNNLTLRGAATRVTAAEAAAVQAGAKMGPSIGAGGSAGAGAVEGGGAGTGGAGLNVAWEVDLWGRLASLESASQEQLAAAQAQYEFARESLAAQTAKAWYLASATQQQLNLSRDTVATYTQLAEIARTRAAAGQVTPQDVNLAQSDLASAQERERYALGAHEDALRGLEVLMGRYPSAELEAADHSIPVPAPVPAGIPSEVLERRPDMIAAESQVRAAFQNVRAAQLAKLPSLTLTAGGGVASSGLLESIGGGPGFFGIGANFFAPIYDGGAMDAQITIETANQEQALAAYGQQALIAFSEVEKGLSAERLLAEREQLLKAALDQNEEALRLARVRYEAGRTPMLDVLQLQARSNQSRAALINIQQLRIAQRIDLHLALGGSFENR